MALSVFAGSLVVLGFAVPETRLIAPIACAPLQLASGSRVALPLQCVAHVPSEEAAARESSQQLAEHLLAGVERALSDRRRIDELVAFFEYGGIVELDGKPSFEGQGAVKRFLTALLVDLEVRKVSQDEAAVSVTLTDPTGRSRELLLHPHAQSDKPGAGGIVLISELRVSERDGASGHDASALFAEHFGARGVGDGARVGPKWETFDGRVRQRIWQHADVFSPGNRFLVKTMELMTDRLIMIVDQTVWQLYGDKMQAWAESVDLRLDAIVAPGTPPARIGRTPLRSAQHGAHPTTARALPSVTGHAASTEGASTEGTATVAQHGARRLATRRLAASPPRHLATALPAP